MRTMFRCAISDYSVPVLIAAAMLASFPSQRAEAQSCDPQIARLIALGGTNSDGFAFSVAVSGDGQTAMVGALEVGKVYVFTNGGGPWTQQGPPLIPADGVGPNQFFGYSVSLNADGNTALIGAANDNHNFGAAYVFIRSGTNWIQQGPKLVPTGSDGESVFGITVSISGDGNTALVGAPYDSNYNGAAYVFVRSGGVWTQQGVKLVPSSGVNGSQFGTSVSVNGDGNTALIGAGADSNNTGAAYVFARSGDEWTAQGGKLVPTGGVGPGYFGWTGAIALSADGGTAAIGAGGDNGVLGAAYVFVRSGGAWVQQGSKLLPTDEAVQGQFGYSVSVSGDGNTAVIGARSDNNAVGAAYIFLRSGSIWAQEGAKLVPSEITGPSQVGSSVAISAGGNTAVIAAPFANSGVGAAYVYGVNIDPQIDYSQQPVSVTIRPGAAASFSIGAASELPLSYQWRRFGLNIVDGPTATGSILAGATTPTLTIMSAALADSGAIFDCVVSNSCDLTTSASAILSVRCLGDLTADNLVGLDDLAKLVSHYGMVGNATYADGDLDGDRDVDLSDLAILLSLYGKPCS